MLGRTAYDIRSARRQRIVIIIVVAINEQLLLLHIQVHVWTSFLASALFVIIAVFTQSLVLAACLNLTMSIVGRVPAAAAAGIRRACCIFVVCASVLCSLADLMQIHP